MVLLPVHCCCTWIIVWWCAVTTEYYSLDFTRKVEKLEHRRRKLSTMPRMKYQEIQRDWGANRPRLLVWCLFSFFPQKKSNESVKPGIVSSISCTWFTVISKTYCLWCIVVLVPCDWQTIRVGWVNKPIYCMFYKKNKKKNGRFMKY